MLNFELIEFSGVDHCEIRCRDFCTDNDVDTELSRTSTILMFI